MVLLTPHVIRNQEEARKVTSGYIDRLENVDKKDIDLKREQMKIDNVEKKQEADIKGTDTQKDIP